MLLCFTSLNSWILPPVSGHPPEMEKGLTGNFNLPNLPACGGDFSHGSHAQSALTFVKKLRNITEHYLAPHTVLSCLTVSASLLSEDFGLTPEANGGFVSATLWSLTNISWNLVLYFAILSSPLSSQCPLQFVNHKLHWMLYQNSDGYMTVIWRKLM